MVVAVQKLADVPLRTGKDEVGRRSSPTCFPGQPPLAQVARFTEGHKKGNRVQMGVSTKKANVGECIKATVSAGGIKNNDMGQERCENGLTRFLGVSKGANLTSLLYKKAFQNDLPLEVGSNKKNTCRCIHWEFHFSFHVVRFLRNSFILERATACYLTQLRQMRIA